MEYIDTEEVEETEPEIDNEHQQGTLFELPPIPVPTFLFRELREDVQKRVVEENIYINVDYDWGNERDYFHEVISDRYGIIYDEIEYESSPWSVGFTGALLENQDIFFDYLRVNTHLDVYKLPDEVYEQISNSLYITNQGGFLDSTEFEETATDSYGRSCIPKFIIKRGDEHLSTLTVDDIETQFISFVEEAEDFLADVLEQEYNHLTSYEEVEDLIECAEYRYDEEGNVV